MGRSGFEIEGCALTLLREARMDGVAKPDLRVLPGALGWTLTGRPPRTHHGVLDVKRKRLAADLRGDDRDVAVRIGHELGHVALLLDGVPLQEHPEREAEADAIGVAVALPREALTKLVRRHGLTPPAVLTEYPHLPPIMVLSRAANVSEHTAIIYARGRRIACGASWTTPTLPRERQLAAAARERGLPVRGDGATAWPFYDVDGSLAVAVVAEG